MSNHPNNGVRECDIFISYRRNGGDMTALHVYESLKARGYNVFYDLEVLRSGKFNKALLQSIQSCKDFVLILSPHALDRCEDEGDWVRMEIREALRGGKNIVPIIMKGFDFPENLPEDIEELRYQNGLTSTTEYFEASIDRLCERYLYSKPTAAKRAKKLVLPIIAVVAVLALGVVGWNLSNGAFRRNTAPELTEAPTPEITVVPTAAPTEAPTPEPTTAPTPEITATPTAAPTDTPTPDPTATPTEAPTSTPSPAPTAVAAEPVTGEIADSWDEILAAIDDGTARERYAVGAWKPLDMGQFGTVNMQLAGFELDTRADAKSMAETTWIARELLPEGHRMNPVYDGSIGTGIVGGWGICELRHWLNETVLPAIPDDIRDSIVVVKKRQNSKDSLLDDTLQTTEDSLWIPDYNEVFGKNSLYFSLFSNEPANRIKERNGTAARWWLRSIYDIKNVCTVNSYGNTGYSGPSAVSGGVLLGFCLGKDESEKPAVLQEGEISDSWEEIIAAIADGTAQQRYAVGAYKPLSFGQFGTINMQLAGFDLDTRADGSGKAATTWIAMELLPGTQSMNPEYDGAVGTGMIGGWEKTQLRQYLNTTVMLTIPWEIRSKMVEVEKTQPGYDASEARVDQTTADRLWVPSYDEVFGADSRYFELFRDEPGRRVREKEGKPVWWWLRSAHDGSQADFVNLYGNPKWDYAQNPGNIVVCFCL